MKKGLRRLYTCLHKTDRRRTAVHLELVPSNLSTEVVGWRKCTTLQPLPPEETECTIAICIKP